MTRLWLRHFAKDMAINALGVQGVNVMTRLWLSHFAKGMAINVLGV